MARVAGKKTSPIAISCVHGAISDQPTDGPTNQQNGFKSRVHVTQEKLLQRGSLSVWELQCVGVTLCGSRGVWESWCVGVVVCGSQDVWESWCVGVAVCGCCGMTGAWKSQCVGGKTKKTRCNVVKCTEIFFSCIHMLTLHFLTFSQCKNSLISGVQEPKYGATQTEADLALCHR